MKTSCIKVMAATGLTLFASIPLARADVPVADKSIATQLFKEGRALLDQGQVALACRKLEESERLEPGGGTLLNLALCHEREGRTATAWEEFTEALGMAKRDDHAQRIEFARSHIAQLESVLSRIYVQVPSAADLPDLEIKRDGSPLGRAAWGSPIPADPGDHLIEVSAPGKIPWKESVVVGTKADVKTVVVPVLQSAPASDVAGASGAPVTPSPAGGTAETADSITTTRTVPAPNESSSPPPAAHSGGSLAPALIAFGVGAAAAGVATYFAVHAISEKNDADRACPNDQCSASGASDNSDAIKSANFATAGFIVGGVGVGLGTILLITHLAGSHGSSAKATESGLTGEGTGVYAGPNGAGFRLSGRW